MPPSAAGTPGGSARCLLKAGGKEGVVWGCSLGQFGGEVVWLCSALTSMVLAVFKGNVLTGRYFFLKISQPHASG